MKAHTHGLIPAFEMAIPVVEFRRCRFTNLAGSVYAPAACEFAAVQEARFADCLWHNPAAYAAQGTGVRVQVQGTARRVVFSGDNTFRWLSNGIRCDPRGETSSGRPVAAVEEVTVDGAQFDGYWWLLPARYSGEGAGVTYTTGAVTDADADFSGIPTDGVPAAYAGKVNVRAMPVRRSGPVTSATGATLVDSGADFVSAGAVRGEIVRSGNRFAVVLGCGSADVHTLELEGWLDNDSLLPADPPAPGDDYTLYGVYLIFGEAAGTTTMKSTGRPWKTLRGEQVTPAAGTRYEVLPPIPYYPVNCNAGTRTLRVANCTFNRSWADQIGGYAQENHIIGNLFQDGQDVGCTLQGGQRGHVVIGNRFRHQGTISLYVNATDSVVVGNRSDGGSWWTPYASNGQFVLVDAARNMVAFNSSATGTESANPTGCVGLQPRSAVNSANVIVHNHADGAAGSADVSLYGDNGADNEIVGSSSIAHLSGAAGQLVEAVGAGSPEGALAAAPGSTYRRTDGSGGSSFYVKESGAGASGWAAK